MGETEFRAVSLRLPNELFDRMDAFMRDNRAHGREPSTITTLVRAALGEYLDRHTATLYDGSDDDDRLIAAYAKRGR